MNPAASSASGAYEHEDAQRPSCACNLQCPAAAAAAPREVTQGPLEEINLASMDKPAALDQPNAPLGPNDGSY